MKSERLNRELDFAVQHLGLVPDEAGKRLHDRWLVTIEGEAFDYFTGIGHRKYKKPGPAAYRHRAYTGSEGGLYARWIEPCSAQVRGFIENDTKVVPPSLDDVLYCLLMDSGAVGVSFSDWCSDFGYDEDSRKALATYEACQKNADKVRKFIPDLEKAREAFQDY